MGRETNVEQLYACACSDAYVRVCVDDEFPIILSRPDRREMG